MTESIAWNTESVQLTKNVHPDIGVRMHIETTSWSFWEVLLTLSVTSEVKHQAEDRRTETRVCWCCCPQGMTGERISTSEEALSAPRVLTHSTGSLETD